MLTYRFVTIGMTGFGGDEFSICYIIICDFNVVEVSFSFLDMDPKCEELML